MRHFPFHVLACAMLVWGGIHHGVAGVANEVAPFIGGAGGGNVFIGPCLPFGMAKPGPDVGKNDQNSGWSPDGVINGFSQTHVSGTGGGNKYGNILVQPTSGEVLASGYSSPRADEHVTTGFYGVTLKRYGIGVEIAAAERAALYRFNYSASDPANLIFDVSHSLVGGKQWGENQALFASKVTVRSPTEVSGSSSVSGGWNLQVNPYTVFFYAVTDVPATNSGTWSNGELHPGTNDQAGLASDQVGAWLSFAPKEHQQVRLKIGISFVSEEKAKENALKIPGFDFDAVRKSAVDAWDKVLGSIELTEATPDQRKMFYTSLYHAMLMPVDRTGDNPLWDSREPYYDDFYAIWDTFRSSSPLLTLIARDRQSDIVRALVDIYRHEGWLPDARSGNYNGRTQGGSDADIVLADAFEKKLPGIDWPTAYAAAVKDAESSPVDQFKEGRGGLEDWKNLGYLSTEGVDRSGSKQMEYAANDFAVATLARGLGKTTDMAKYFQRAKNWENLWNPYFQDGGISGFIQPKHRDGTWKTNFTATQGCSWGGDTFYEGNSWVYSLFVPQDMPGLIAKCGGPEKFIQRLDAFFNGRFDVSNEPGFLTPYLYAWAGRHDKTCERVRQILADRYHPTMGGLPGNDDSGAMSSWYVFSALGIFPVAGQDLYVIGSPIYPKSTWHLAGHKDFTIEAKNVSVENKYVTAATLNGAPLKTPWLHHRDIVNGGTLVLNMSPAPENWGKAQQ